MVGTLRFAHPTICGIGESFSWRHALDENQAVVLGVGWVERSDTHHLIRRR